MDGGHTTETSAALTSASVVSRDLVRIALTLAALNGLAVLACDIQNVFLAAQCREKIWTVAGPEFGSEIGKIFINKMALYGLKSSGAEFFHYLRRLCTSSTVSPLRPIQMYICDQQ